MPSVLPFTPDDFAESGVGRRTLIPALRGAEIEEGSTASSRSRRTEYPLMGESRDCAASGSPRRYGSPIGRRRARRWPSGSSTARPRWTSTSATSTGSRRTSRRPAYIARARASRTTSRSTTSSTRSSRWNRGRCDSPVPRAARQELGAFFLEGGGWERPQWYEANAALIERTATHPRARRLGGALLVADRRRRGARDPDGVALYDMTSLKRLEVTRPGRARLPRAADDQPPGPAGRARSSTRCCSMSDGGIRSDLTIARLGRTGSRSAPTATSTSTGSSGTRRPTASVRGPRHHRGHVLHRPVGPERP